MMPVGELIKSTTGRALKAGITPLALGTAVALGVHSHNMHQPQDPNDPNPPGLFSSIKEGLLDFAMGDPYADVDMMGFPITAADMIPMPGVPKVAKDIGRNVSALNYMRENGGLSEMIQDVSYMDRQNNWYMNQAQANVDRGYTTTDYGMSSKYPYMPQTRMVGASSGATGFGVNADGQMVMGMYNRRMG